MDKSITIKYRTQRNYCQCCGQKLEKPKTSEAREFTFTKENFLEWSEEWDEIAKYDDLIKVVEEFVYDTIQFYATSSFENILIEGVEIGKAKQFVIDEIVSS